MTSKTTNSASVTVQTNRADTETRQSGGFITFLSTGHAAQEEEDDYFARRENFQRHGYNTPVSRLSLHRSLHSIRSATWRRRQARDAEHGPVTEHVILSIAGLTCVGCEEKVLRALRGISGVSNISISFLNSRADFDLDVSFTSLDDVIRRVRTATGLQSTPTLSDYQQIDIIVPPDRELPSMAFNMIGLVAFEESRDRHLRLTYNPKLLQVRLLLERLCGTIDCLAPVPTDPGLLRIHSHLKALLIKTVSSAIFTVPVLAVAYGSEQTRFWLGGQVVSLVLATFVQAIAVPEFYNKAFATLLHDRTLDLDMLVVISITAAYIYSIVAFGLTWAGKPLEISSFFETSTLLVTLLLFGRLIALYTRFKAIATTFVAATSQETISVLTTHGQMQELDVRLLQPDDTFCVPPGTAIPTDGIITAGCSEVDESSVTGESLPVSKSAGDKVIAGTMNRSGMLMVRLSRLPSHSTTADIRSLVEKAASTRPKIQELADRISRYFIPAILIVALISFVVWMVIGSKRSAQSTAFASALTYAIAVLAVSCPCALGLAVPMVLAIVGALAARRGVIIKSSDAVEKAWQITDVIFDKTGTLTMSELDLTDEHFLASDTALIRSITLALVKSNEHPISRSIKKELERYMLQALELEKLQVLPGCGVEAIFGDVSVVAGSPSWTDQGQHPIVQGLISQGRTVLCVTAASSLVAVYGLSAILRPEALTVVSELRRRGLILHVLSGDTDVAVRSCARMLGIAPEHTRSRCSPIDKQQYVAALIHARTNCHKDASEHGRHHHEHERIHIPRAREHNDHNPNHESKGHGDDHGHPQDCCTHDHDHQHRHNHGCHDCGEHHHGPEHDKPHHDHDEAGTIPGQKSHRHSHGPDNNQYAHYHGQDHPRTKTGKQKARRVLFVGDGSNDALALSTATFGVQIGPVSDLLSSVACVSLLSNDLSGILYLLDTSRQAYRRIVFNFAWALVYNLLAVVLAAGVAVVWRIAPRYAGLGEVVSVLPVILVSCTMMWTR